MKTTENAVRDRKGFARLTLVIVLIFAVMGASIWAVSKKTSDDMADAAILNLNENLNLVESTVEAIQDSEAQFQRLLATELAAAGDPAAAVERLGKSDAAALISVVPEGADVGVSNDGAPFDPASLDFSGGGAIKGLPVSQAYVNAEGSWAYTVKCPIERDGVPIAELYTEYTFDAIDQSLPQGFYGQRAVLYLMDAATERFVLKPEGMGERDAGHVNLEDFYRANNITDPVILSMVADGVANRENVMFAHKVKGTEALCYLWSIGDGTTYLVGYVPMEAIQREAQAVNVALIMVASITIAAFCLCVILYGFNRRKQARARRAREEERALHAEQLAQALRAAEVANESKSAFLANMSHDIRTPYERRAWLHHHHREGGRQPREGARLRRARSWPRGAICSTSSTTCWTSRRSRAAKRRSPWRSSIWATLWRRWNPSSRPWPGTRGRRSARRSAPSATSASSATRRTSTRFC